MLVKSLDIKPSATGDTILQIRVDLPPSEFSDTLLDINNGKKFELVFKEYRHNRSLDQNACIWAKIGEIAHVLYANKEDIYEEMLRRYGPIYSARTYEKYVGDLRQLFRVVDIVPEKSRDDGTVFVKMYKGISQMDSAEASRLLEGILSECKELGINSEVRECY